MRCIKIWDTIAMIFFGAIDDVMDVSSLSALIIDNYIVHEPYLLSFRFDFFYCMLF